MANNRPREQHAVAPIDSARSEAALHKAILHVFSAGGVLVEWCDEWRQQTRSSSSKGWRTSGFY